MFEHSYYFPANQNTRLMLGTKEFISESATEFVTSWVSSACSFVTYFSVR
jgi:hypothetical protein